MPEPDCFLRYRISAATRNFTSGISQVYVLARRGFNTVLFTQPSKHLCRRYMRSTECPSSSFIHSFISWPVKHNGRGIVYGILCFFFIRQTQHLCAICRIYRLLQFVCSLAYVGQGLLGTYRYETFRINQHFFSFTSLKCDRQIEP